MPAYAYALLAAGWLLWLLPFLLANKNRQPAKQVDKRARWGILLVAIAYSLLWQGPFWERSPQPWRLAISVLFFAVAALLSWTGTRALGRQWRVDAGLNADHNLITAGPYRFVRHPIYTSMFTILFATGFLLAVPWWLLALSLALMIAGTEIRILVEDHLLAAQFGERFAGFKRRVPAYIPFLR